MADPQAGRRLTLYGRRRGRRLRAGQQELLSTMLPKLEIALPESGGLLDLAALFGPPTREVWLEIGFGGGEHLAAQAKEHPGIGLIGAEFFVNGVASLLGHLTRRAIGNVRIYPGDARPLLSALPDRSIGRAFLLFPDPWPKARHARRRFLTRGNLAELARILGDGAELRIASDDPAYVAWTLEQIHRCPHFEWLAQGPVDWRQPPEDWPATRYEAKALKAGRRPVYLRFRRRTR
ncbi:MAG TPA: tRNA (guanine(46)-N(7))-methyltransferase TrmB [Alphaproteobacteria bacterium]|jgi:tRNA (guanine-N7-)-methyltransferase|nr:tRNA (guanine(46)-N(7))-methyltransferase TrmB [Alphaproteobacteria bacterium]